MTNQTDSIAAAPVAGPWRERWLMTAASARQRLAVPGSWPVSLPGMVFVLSLAAMATALLWPHYHPTQPYHDIVAGAITLTDSEKVKDYRALEFFCGTALLLGIGLSALTHALSAGRAAVRRSVDLLLTVSLVPLIFWLAFTLGAGAARTWPVEAAAAQTLTLLLLVGLLRWRGPRLDAEALLQTGLRAQFAAVLTPFAALGVVVFCTRALHLYSAWAMPQASWRLAAEALGAASLVIAALFAVSPLPSRLIARLDSLLLAVQAFLPLVFFMLLPPARFQGTKMLAEPRPVLLTVLLSAAILASWWQLLRLRERRGDSARDGAIASWRAIVSPLCIAAAGLVLQSCPQTAVIGLAISPHRDFDYFHWGEQLLPWQQWTAFGQIPYGDFVPIHGLMPILCGAFNSLFFSGGITGYYAAYSLWQGIAKVLLFLVAVRVWRLEVALLISCSAGAIDRQLLIVPVIFLMSSERLLARPLYWLVAWLVACPVMVLYNGAIGSAFVMASIPVALWIFIALVRAKNREPLWNFLLFAGFVLFVALLPLGRATRGLFVFLLENQKVNTVANGIEWSRCWPSAADGTVLGLNNFELLRMAWLVVAFGAGLVFLRQWSRPEGKRRAQMLCYSVLVGGSLLLIAPWSFNRIDPDAGPSRLGGVAYMAVTALLPAFFDLRRRPIVKVVVLASLIGIYNFFLGSSSSFSVSEMISRATVRLTVSPTAVRVDGGQSGFPVLDGYYAEPGSLDHLTYLRTLLTGFVKPGETYFDLTNNQGLYYILGMRVPGLYAAPYVAASTGMQERMIRQLEREQPPVILASPTSRFDGLSSSIRTPLLYHYALDHYLPINAGDFVLMIRPDRLPPNARPAPDESLLQLRRAFNQSDLASIPSAWGASWPSLSERFKEVAPIKLTHENVRLHDLVWDRQDGLQVAPAEAFSEARYLAANPDIAGAVARGEYRDGREHYDRYGHGENRPGTPLPPDPFLTVDLEPLRLTGGRADFLVLDLAPSAPGDQTEQRVEFRWQTDLETISDPVSCLLRPGKNLVPLGSFPTWTLARQIHALRVDLKSPDLGRGVTLRNLSLLKRQF